MVPSGPAPRAEPPATGGAADRLTVVFGSDPGLNRLRFALQAVVSIAAAMAAEWIFVRLTHALWLPVPPGASVVVRAALAAQHHGMLVIAIMLGAITGLIASFGGPMFASRRLLLLFTLLMPVPMATGLAIGLALGDHRFWALASLVFVLAVGAYCRRFGPVGFFGGQLVFMGDFFGFFLHEQLHVHNIGWLIAEIAIGAVVAAAAQFTVFFPSRSGALRRMVRSYAARERDVATRAVEVFDAGDVEERARAARQLHLRLARLNETALLVDAHLATQGSVPGHWSAAELHQRLFDSELSLTNVARFAERIPALDLDDDVGSRVREALVAVAEVDLTTAEDRARELRSKIGELPGPVLVEGTSSVRAEDRTRQVVVHRFATSVLGFVEATRGWRAATLGEPWAPSGEAIPDRAPFETSVTLFGGWLPGSAQVSATASLEVGHRRDERLTLQPYVRVAIQMAVAVTAAILIGEVLSERRFYWAAIAAFVTFMGANNAGEQLRKGLNRVLGTVVGVLLGALLSHLVGHRTWLAILVLLVALFLGLYLMRISYAFMVVGITIMVSQLYVQLDEFTDSLLVLRLQETAIGAACAALTVLLVLPLRTGRVVRVAAREYLVALSTLVSASVDRLAGTSSESELRTAARDVDIAYQAVVSAMVPLQSPWRHQTDDARTRLGKSVNASRYYARNLVVDLDAETDPLPPQAREPLVSGGARLVASMDELVEGSLHDDLGQRTYVRAAAMFDVASRSLGADEAVTSPRQLALRDLELIDGTVASLAEAMGLRVEALDSPSPEGRG